MPLAQVTSTTNNWRANYSRPTAQNLDDVNVVVAGQERPGSDQLIRNTFRTWGFSLDVQMPAWAVSVYRRKLLDRIVLSAQDIFATTLPSNQYGCEAFRGECGDYILNPCLIKSGVVHSSREHERRLKRSRGRREILDLCWRMLESPNRRLQRILIKRRGRHS